jgi:hypothetical protein
MIVVLILKELVVMKQNAECSTVEELLYFQGLLPCDWIYTLDDIDEPPFWIREYQISFLLREEISVALEQLVVAACAFLRQADCVQSAHAHSIIVNVTIHPPDESDELPLFAVQVVPEPDKLEPMQTWCVAPYSLLAKQILKIVENIDPSQTFCVAEGKPDDSGESQRIYLGLAQPSSRWLRSLGTEITERFGSNLA